MTTWRLFPSTNGPSAVVSYSGNLLCAVQFCVTAEAWFQGYWWWVCPTGQSTAPVKCALWLCPNHESSIGTPQLVSGSVVTSGTLTPGQWNWIPLPTTIPLSLGGSPGMTPPITGLGAAVYTAAIGVNGSFPDTNHSFGSGDVYANGITDGPLTAYSQPSGTMPVPPSGFSGGGNGVFTTAGSDPSLVCPTELTSTDDNLWVDVQVSDYSEAPAGTSLRLWPSAPGIVQAPNGDPTISMSATAFTLSQSCTLNRIWMNNPPGSTGMATRVGIWNTETHTEIAGTDNASPTWLVPGGAAANIGDGWMYVDYTSAGIVLPAGNYAVSFFNGDGKLIYRDDHNYWFAGTDPVGGATVGGAGWNGISWGGGILTAPNVANGPLLVYDDGSGTKHGQVPYQPNAGAWMYPGAFEASEDWGETRWADVEVTPTGSSPSPSPSPSPSSSSSAPPPSTVNSGAFLTFFP